MSALVYSLGEVENVTIDGDSNGYGLEAVGASASRVRVSGTHTTAQIGITGNDGQYDGLVATGGGDGIVVAGVRNNVAGRVTNGDQAWVVSGSNNQVEARSNTAGEEALNLTGSRNQIAIQAMSPGENGITITGHFNRVTGHLWGPGLHGVILSGPDGNIIDMVIEEVGAGTTNTYDAVIIEGDATRNRVRGSITPRASGNTTRRGVFMDTATANNHVTDVDLGDVSAYGTGALVDSGANNIDFPDDATYGDNWNQ